MYPGAAVVVVGVDDAGTADAAVDWAAAEAAARGCSLRVVHAFHPPLPADPYGVASPLDGLVGARAVAEDVLRAHVARARFVASDLDVAAHLAYGSAVQVLLAEASRARLLVTGSRGLVGLRALLGRSVSARVAARAPCPVVVVRPPDGADPDGADGAVPDGAVPDGGAPPRVVVGVDGRSAETPEVGFAFEAARQRGVPLVAVHAWVADPPADLEAVCAPSTVAEAAARRRLDRAVESWHARYPAVPVVTRLVRADPARAIAEESRGAALVVVGTRGRGLVLGALRGSVSRAVLGRVRAPVAVVHRVHHADTRARDGFDAATA